MTIRNPIPRGDDDRAPRDADERQAEEESKGEPASKPGGFENDPDDPTNPNEVRERHLKKLRP
ncbi:MAG TPA: hypothetical protein VIJ37_01755 [Steroidobacteraceae bacterium]